MTSLIHCSWHRHASLSDSGGSRRAVGTVTALTCLSAQHSSRSRRAVGTVTAVTCLSAQHSSRSRRAVDSVSAVTGLSALQVTLCGQRDLKFNNESECFCKKTFILYIYIYQKKKKKRNKRERERERERITVQTCTGFKNLYSRFSPTRALSRPARPAGFL